MTADVEDTRDRGWEYHLPQQCLDSGSAISKRCATSLQRCRETAISTHFTDKDIKTQRGKLGQGHSTEGLGWVSDAGLFGTTLLLEAKGVKP